RMQILSGPGVVFYFLAVTFAAIDWVMAIDAHWYSTIFAPLVAVGQVLNAFSFAILLLALLSGSAPFRGVIQPDVFQDLGKLLLAFVMVWAYFSFSQYLIVWAGNLPEEIRWYLGHSKGGWLALGLFILVFQFFVPFLLLLSRDLKRDMRRLAGVALLVMVMRFIDLFWTVVAAWVLFAGCAERAARRDPKVSPLAPAESQLPPEPRLLVKEHDDLVAVRKEEEELLDTYGWVDKERGIVRIPIARAMEL